MSDILDITCADALLAGRHTLARRNFRACKIRLQRSHARVDQKQRIVIVRDKRKRFHGKMSF